MNKALLYAFTVFLFLFGESPNAAWAYTVSELAAFYRDGQVFITWQNPPAENLRYKVYRSLLPITNTAELGDAAYIGFVRDQSSKNIRKSQLAEGDYFFTIEPAAGSLNQTTGLYVHTSTDAQAWYYAVVVENLLTNEEDQQVFPGENSLMVPVTEQVGSPAPVLQHSYTFDDVTAYEWVIWGNNVSSTAMPAFNNAGSYGYNFTFFERGNSSLPLYLLFRSSDPFTKINSDFSAGKHVLLLDDWMPNGKATDWFGFHELYDMYEFNNPVQTAGTVKAFTQARIHYTLDWILKNQPVDASRVYASGASHNGLGAALTALLHPELFAAVWISVAPILVKAVNGSDWEEVWCDASKNVFTDIINPATNSPYRIFDLLDLRYLYENKEPTGIPFISGVHGKQDYTVGWVHSKFWYDSVNVSKQGGTWYWDQREHDGDGKQFEDEEIKIDFDRFSNDQSYPAFSNCNINQNPGNGTRNSGDPFGAINGFLDWDHASVKDKSCRYTLRCFIKDMTVGGELQTQYDSCKADITLRRLQNFQPQLNDKIRWWAMSTTGTVLQDGYLTYDGNPLTLENITILREGTMIQFRIKDCQEVNGEKAEHDQTEEGELDQYLDQLLDQSFAASDWENQGTKTGAGEQNREINFSVGEETIEYPEINFFRSGSGYLVETKLEKALDVLVQMTDMTGRVVIFKKIPMTDGSNEFNLDANRGNYLFSLFSPEFTFQRKLSF
jgi:hypothetical protein